MDKTHCASEERRCSTGEKEGKERRQRRGMTRCLNSCLPSYGWLYGRLGLLVVWSLVLPAECTPEGAVMRAGR